MNREKNAEQARDIELTAQEIKEKLPLMLQHVINFYDIMLPKEFVGEERLKTIKILDWAWQVYNGDDVMAKENARNGMIYNDEVCRNMPQIIEWNKVLLAIGDLNRLQDENITKPAFRQSGLLNQPLVINGEEKLQPRDYYVGQFMRTCKGQGIH